MAKKSAEPKKPAINPKAPATPAPPAVVTQAPAARTPGKARATGQGRTRGP
jgi:hypothetical protein